MFIIRLKNETFLRFTWPAYKEVAEPGKATVFKTFARAVSFLETSKYEGVVEKL